MSSGWGRHETVIWPPRKPIHTWGAAFLALILTGLFCYVHYSWALTPLERFYLPEYLRATMIPTFRPTAKYRVLLVADRSGQVRYAGDANVQEGKTPAPEGKSLPLALSESARRSGLRNLYLSDPLMLQTRAWRDYLTTELYRGEAPWTLFLWPMVFGLLSFLFQLPSSIRKDIRRFRELKYGRRLKGPVMVTPRQFNREFRGTGIGIKTDDCPQMLRIPAQAEDQHIEIIGDTGSGKTTIIMQLLRQIQARGHSAIVYDPACEFIQRFYDASRGDIVLNPLDRRCPYWGPSEELIRRAEARTIAASLFQPTTDRKGEFFIESPQKIFAHLLLSLPTPQQLVDWMSHPDEIDEGVKGTELAALIDKKAPQQRSGVLGSLSLVADSFRLLPTRAEAAYEWTARQWSENRQGWIFITSQPAEREALRPLHSLWIDMLVLRLLSEPKPGQRPVWFVLDELASLQKLPQLHTAITENRKSRNPIILGFQGKAQLEVIYGHLAEVMLSQPATKIFLKTTEPNAAEWVSRARIPYHGEYRDEAKKQFGRSLGLEPNQQRAHYNLSVVHSAYPVKKDEDYEAARVELETALTMKNWQHFPPVDAVKALLLYNLGCCQGWLLAARATDGAVLRAGDDAVKKCLANLGDAALLGVRGIEAIGKTTVERDCAWDKPPAQKKEDEGDLVALYGKGDQALKTALENVKQELLASAARS